MISLNSYSEFDKEFSETLEANSIRYEVISDFRMEDTLKNLYSSFGDAFELCPVRAGPSKNFDNVSYRIRNRSCIIVFYAIISNIIEGKLFVANEVVRENARPEKIFCLERPSAMSILYGDSGGIDHISFGENFDFLIVHDVHDLLVGYGKARGWVENFKNSYPDFFL